MLAQKGPIVREHLTKTLLQAVALPLARQRKTIYDTKVPALAVRVTSTGAKTFYVIKRAGTSMAWFKLGAFPDMTVEQARAEAGKVLGEFATGANPAAVKRALKEEPTFAEALEIFLKDKRKRDGTPIGAKTKKDYADLLRLHMDGIKAKKLSAIERTEIKATHTRVTKGSPAQADKCVALVSAVFSFMKDMEHFAGPNPAERIKKNPPIERDRYLLSDELARFFQALADMPSPTMRDFFMVALLTGARRANVASMRWQDIDMGAGLWRIAMTKNGTPQNVTLSPEAVAVLQQRKDLSEGTSSGYVFPGTGSTGHIVEPKRAWARLLEAANIEGLRVHDLRRTLGSWQARTGTSLAIIGKSLNHKTQRATGIYARLDLHPVRQSVNAATSAMMEAAGLKQPAQVVPLLAKAA